MAKGSNKGSKPLSTFVEITTTEGKNKNGEDAVFYHVKKRITNSKGYGMNVILDDLPVDWKDVPVDKKTGKKGVWLKWYWVSPGKGNY